MPRGTKMDLGSFLGDSPKSNAGELPSGPRQRADGDDGAFRRAPRRDEEGYEPSRSENDSSWRRGGPPASSSSGGGFGGGGDRNGGDRRGGGGRFDDRRGGGGGYDDRRGGGGGYDDRRGGGGGYDERRSGGGGGFDDRRGGSGAPPSSGGRPRLNLVKRSAPAAGDEKKGSSPSPSSSKTNPFGGASAVDTASKLAKLDLKAQKSKEEVAKKEEDEGGSSPSPSTGKPKANPFGGASAVDTASKLAELDLKLQKSKSGTEQNKEEEKAAAPVDKAEEAPKNGADANVKSKPDAETSGTDVDKHKGESSAEDDSKPDEKGEEEKKDRRERKRREPKVVNSRAAMLEATIDHGAKEAQPRRERADRPPRGDAPPLVANRRVADLADEEKDKLREREERRAAYRAENQGPPPEVNSRFAAAAAEFQAEQADRLPPRDLAPPPVQKGRFAAAAAEFEAEKEREIEERAERYGRVSPRMDEGPLVPTNSRFAAAVAADGDYVPAERRGMDRDRDEMDGGGRFDDRQRMGGGDRYGRGLPRMDEPPPAPRNSRFAAAVAADEDYVPAERRNNDRDREDRDGGDRFGDRGDDRGFGDDRRGGGFGGRGDDRRGGGGFGGDNRRGGYDDRRGGFSGGRGGGTSLHSLPKGPAGFGHSERGAEDHFQVPALKKKEPEPELPKVAVPMALPGESEEEAKARIEKKRREAEEQAAAEKKAAEEAAAAKAAAEKEAADAAAKAAEKETDLISDFTSGKNQGEALSAWFAEQGALLPSVEKLVYHLLVETQGKNPNPDCPWAESDNYGAGLLSLVSDNVHGMMEVLWGIQKFCDNEGFPKVGDEYLVQAMFRSMYKHDLVDDEAFAEWKEDESDEHSEGKMKAIIQTMDWFAWLEEDDESDDDDDDEEGDYEEDFEE